MENIIIFGSTDTGLVRTNNEDFYYYCGNILQQDWSPSNYWFPLKYNLPVFILADGMGGENAGEVASEVAVFSIDQFLKKNLFLNLEENQIKKILEDSILQAHNNIIQEAVLSPSRQGMGTTIVLACIINKKLYISWVGDSRLYIFTSEKTKNLTRKNQTGRLQLITDDHSVVWEEVLSGRMTAEQARNSPMSNVITQSLGDPLSFPSPGYRMIDLHEDDTILICSDGLNGMLSDPLIEEILVKQQNMSLEATANELIMQAKKAGGKDNITMILSKVSSVPSLENQPPVIENKINSEISKTFKFDHLPHKRKKKNNKFLYSFLSMVIFALVGMSYYVYVWMPQNYDLPKSFQLQEEILSDTINIDTNSSVLLNKDSLNSDTINCDSNIIIDSTFKTINKPALKK